MQISGEIDADLIVSFQAQGIPSIPEKVLTFRALEQAQFNEIQFWASCGLR